MAIPNAANVYPGLGFFCVRSRARLQCQGCPWYTQRRYSTEYSKQPVSTVHELGLVQYIQVTDLAVVTVPQKKIFLHVAKKKSKGYLQRGKKNMMDKRKGYLPTQ